MDGGDDVITKEFGVAEDVPRVQIVVGEPCAERQHGGEQKGNAGQWMSIMQGELVKRRYGSGEQTPGNQGKRGYDCGFLAQCGK